jgi:hypothetical protein
LGGGLEARWAWELEAIGRTEICGECIRSERSVDEIPTNDENEDYGKILRSSINALRLAIAAQDSWQS